MDISNIIDKKIWLAPLAGYTDRAYRQLCKIHGADVLVSEMVSADGLVRDSKKTVQYILFDEAEKPFGIQIFGSDPYVMAKAAEFCQPWNPDFIDINMGCPVKKVFRRGAGSALMLDQTLASEIVSRVVEFVGGSCPVGVKFRSGINSQSLNYIEFGMAMQAAGADFICLHPRTQTQMFSGKSAWEHIKGLKAALDIPLIGNGDILNPELAQQMFFDTGCDSVMIGRGSLGRPWIFRQAKELMATGDYAPIRREEILEAIMTHIDLALKYKPERIVTKELRSQLCHYTKGIPGGAELRQQINHAENTALIRELVRNSPAFKI